MFLCLLQEVAEGSAEDPRFHQVRGHMNADFAIHETLALCICIFVIIRVHKQLA